MNEFIDPRNGKMIAQTAGNSCEGCFYGDVYACPEVHNGNSYCRASERTDKQNIIWIKAVDTKKISN